ncbi:MAG: hypothetical protein Q8J97_05095, partial [Flavobacteriaceae bacterium]|nr:hypothetical protein [Flavobacteriaceae bacterium]
IRMVYRNATHFNDPASYEDAKDLVENFGVFGLFAVDLFNSIFAWVYAVENGIPMIAPTATYDLMFTPIARNTFFIQPSLAAETFQMLNYALNSNLHCWHMTVLYFAAVEELANSTRAAIVGFGYPEPLLVSLDYASPGTFDYDMISIANAVFGNTSINYRCHVVLDAVDGMTQIVKHFHKDPRFNAEDSYFIVPSVANLPLHVDDEGSTATFKNVFLMQASPDPRDGEIFASVKSYHESMARFFATPNWQATIPTALVSSVDTVNYNFEAYQAYIDTRFLIEILSRMTSFTRAGMIDTVYRTKMFEIDDIVLGPYIDSCGNKFSTLPCWCNAGNKLLFTMRVVDGKARIVYDDSIFGESQVAY